MNQSFGSEASRDAAMMRLLRVLETSRQQLAVATQRVRGSNPVGHPSEELYRRLAQIDASCDLVGHWLRSALGLYDPEPRSFPDLPTNEVPE